MEGRKKKIIQKCLVYGNNNKKEGAKKMMEEKDFTKKVNDLIQYNKEMLQMRTGQETEILTYEMEYDPIVPECKYMLKSGSAILVCQAAIPFGSNEIVTSEVLLTDKMISTLRL